MATEAETYIRTQVENGIATVVLDRPPLNVLHIPMLEKLDEAVESLARSEEVRAMVLQAEGKMFSAGVDVADHTPEKVGEMIPLFNRACMALFEFPHPTIAVVAGHALGGGCELVVCCDLAVMAEGAKIGQPEIHLAAFAPVAAVRLPALVGYRAAADLMFTGRSLEAKEALEMGLVNAVVPADEVEGWAKEKANQVVSMSGAAQANNKVALQLGAAHGRQALAEIERIYLEELMKTEDAKEGLDAFIEKRPPVWKHK
jgi:cyclohexa-1,5-dienecarbonyl-CoA hydratase